MTIHKSLKSRDVLKRQRNVLGRWERIESLREQETWEEGRSVYGLPKVKVQAQRKRVKAKKEPTEQEAAEAEAAQTTDAETPGTKPQGSKA